MKLFKYFFVLGIALMGVVACVHDKYSNELALPQPEEDQLSYLQLKINAAVSSRLINENDQVFRDDNVIHQLDIYLLQKHGEDYIVVDKIWRDNVREGEPSEEDGLLHDVLVKTKVDPGLYAIYVVANAKQEFKDNILVDVDGYQQINKELIYPLDVGAVIDKIEKGIMVMSIQNRDNKGLFTNLVQLNYNSKNHPAQGEVSLDRIGAATKVVNEDKIDYSNLKYEGRKVVLADGYELVVAGFVTLNLPKGTRLSQQWDKVNNDTEQFLTPTLLDNTKEYHHPLSTYAVLTDGKVTGIQKEAVDLFTADPKALIENNSNKAEELAKGLMPLQYATTGVIFCLKIRKKDSDSPSQPFYAQIEGNKVRLLPLEGEVTTPRLEYPHGMFYTYFIEDPNQVVWGDKYLAIVRNTAYKINLTSISQMGSLYPGGDLPNPEDEEQRVEKKDTYQVRVTVNRWKNGSWDIHL